MASRGIVGFKIEMYSMEVTVAKERGEVTHKYWSVPPEIVRWFINCKTKPELADLEKKISDHRAKENKKDAVCCSSSDDFWSCKD